jgi:hypothetical protein
MEQGLQVIESRVDALNRFTTAYACGQVASFQRQPVALSPLVSRAIGLETRLPVVLSAGLT